MKIIVRIKGGLGNQLFCYAAARRLSFINKSELVIDDVTGFVRDHYRRKYSLDHFHISCRKATAQERMEPFERYRRGLFKWFSNRQPFDARKYIEQEGNYFDERLLNLKPQEVIYLDGYWQSEDYFKDVEQTIRNELRITPPIDRLNQEMAMQIHSCDAVALHVRWYERPGSGMIDNISSDYYQRSIAMLEEKLNLPHYFLFSDFPDDARVKLELPKGRVTYISHNKGDANSYADLWLMTQCNHYITANSTFSWWGAWLNSNIDKIVVTPKQWFNNETSLQNLIPQSWVRL